MVDASKEIIQIKDNNTISYGYYDDRLGFVLHNDAGWAIQVDLGDGFTREIWYSHNRRHRIDGPASITRGYNTTIIAFCYWYLRGELLDFQKWLLYNDEVSDEQKTMLVLTYG